MKNKEYKRNTEKKKLGKKLNLKTQYGFLEFSGDFPKFFYNYLFNPQTLNDARRTFFKRRLAIAIFDSFPIVFRSWE